MRFLDKAHDDRRVYIGTFVSLLGLATLSLCLPTASLTLSLAIAVLKAVLVLLFFMHLREATFSARFVMLISAVLVAIFIGLTALDPLTRAERSAASIRPQAAEGE